MNTPEIYDPALSQLDLIRKKIKEQILGPNSTGVGYFDERAAHDMLRSAYEKGVPIDVLFGMISESTSWMKFSNRIIRAKDGCL